MRRVVVIVEGPTEEQFIAGPLAEALWPRQIWLVPIILGVPGHRGGRTNYARVQKDLVRQLKQDRTACCSTMLDYYGLGRGFPGTSTPSNMSSLERVRHIEREVKQDICGRIPDFNAEARLIPYLSLHEFEGLLFSEPDAMARGMRQPQHARGFRAIRDEFSTPEEINDRPETAPSKRISSIYPGYRKVIEGTQAAREVGIHRMREECEHFRNWLEQLEALSDQ